MEKKTYEALELEVTEFEIEDCARPATSGDPTTGYACT